MRKPTDQDLDIAVAGMLRFGVTLAAIIVLGGGVVYLWHPWARLPGYAHFNAGDRSLRTITGILHGLVSLNPQSIIQLGLVVLILTPVMRVVFCVAGFARQGSRLYVAISSIVLLVLVYSLTKGGAYR
jgi:uncharacterized membrane protein